MNKNFYTLNDLRDVALGLLGKYKVFCFYGPMGVGKTTLIKVLLKELGTVEAANSPTFGLVNEYHDADENLMAYHFDFYRINSLEEAMDIGLEDYFASDAHIFIEWPGNIEALLPKDCLKVFLRFVDEYTRAIEY